MRRGCSRKLAISRLWKIPQLGAVATCGLSTRAWSLLQQIKESWPGPGPNKVRLPGGKYIKPGFAAWCKLHDAHGARIAEDGRGAACVLLDYQTPAELVPQSPESGDVTH